VRKIKLIAVALLILLAFSACTSDETAAAEKENKETVRYIDWTPVYNDHQCVRQTNPTQPQNLKQLLLTEKQIQSLVPEELLRSMKTTGFAEFRGETVYQVILQMRLQEGFATVVLGENVTTNACCASIGHGINDQKSACGDATFTIYRKIKSGGMELTALGEVNDVLMLVSIDSKNPQNDKLVFERILEAFSRVKGTGLTLSGIKPN